jgi:hypothetical protein
MNIKAKSHLKHINIKIYSKKNLLIPETPWRNIYRYVSVVFLVPDGVPERHIPGVPTGTTQN